LWAKVRANTRGSFWAVCLCCHITCLWIVLPVAAAPTSAELRAEFDQALADFDQAQNVLAQQPDRARQLFRAAAQRFESIIGAGVVNGHLEFNLANCYLQSGDAGRAILHYRRAQRLIPRDPMLTDNLGVSRSRCLTTIQPSRGGALMRFLFAWHYDTSLASRFEVAVALYVAFWALLIMRNYLRRRFVTVVAMVVCIMALAGGSSLAVTRWTDRNTPEGVVTAMDVTVYKGPGTGYQRQFEQPLQPGVEFTRTARRGEWWRIELADGKSGWIQSTQAELIPTGGAW
jgi:hypothetical protein